MASVSAEDVRDVLHADEADIADTKIQKMINRAQVTLSLELASEIDYSNCAEAEKEAITVLAAIYGLCYLTGGSAAGLSFSVGDLSINNSTLPSLGMLQGEFERILTNLKTPYVGSA